MTSGQHPDHLPADLPPLPGHRQLPCALRRLPDPRTERTPRHALADLLFIALCSLLAGGDSFLDREEFALRCAP